MVVLKRLCDAVAAGDRVLAVVRGSAVNQDGRSNGLMAPNPAAQMAVLRAAYANAGVSPREVDFVEAHGTGTLLGDPIEARALGAVLGRARPAAAPLLIGAVKSNLGHLEAAAGVVGFIKAVLAVHHGHIPATRGFGTPNPHIPFNDLRLKVVAEPTDWPVTSYPRRAGVSSFGFGGTNAHVVLEQAPDPTPAPAAPAVEPSEVVAGSGVVTLVVSGKSAQRVASGAAVLAEWMIGEGASVGLAEVAHTLNHHRSRFAKFATVCARDRAGAITGLQAVAAGGVAPGVVPVHEGPCGPGTVFVYSGQGSQWAGMGRQLLADEPSFAAAVADLEPIFVDTTGFSLQQVLTRGDALSGIDRIQPVLVAFQLALTELWRSYGVAPDAVIGHSMGEVTAAVVAGALTPAEGLHVITTRSRLMKRLAGHGAMALLELDPDTTTTVIAEHPDITIAVYASPRQTVIAGPPPHIDHIITTIDAQGRLARRIDVDVASHHHSIDPILGDLHTALADLHPQPPTIPIITTTHHTPHTPPHYDADHWTANLRNPVNFTHAITTTATTHHTYIEISPHPLLTHAITDTLTTTHHHTIATLHRNNDDTLTFHTNLATVRPPTAEPSPSAGGEMVDLPTTPWHHTHHWLDMQPVMPALNGSHPLLGVHVELPDGTGHLWQADLGTQSHPWLADHQLQGQPILAAAAFAEMALAAGCHGLDRPATALRLHRLDIERVLTLEDHTQVTTQLIHTIDDAVRVEIHSRTSAGTWNRHARAHIDTAPTTTPPAPHPDTGSQISPPDFYTALRRTGTHHGPAFAALTHITCNPGSSARTHITVPEPTTTHRGYHIHPVLLDGALQTLAAALPTETATIATEASYLPLTIEDLHILTDPGHHAHCQAHITHADHADTVGHITITTDTGVTAAHATVHLRRIHSHTVPLPLQRTTFRSTWRPTPTPTPPTAPPSATWLTLTYDAGVPAAIAKAAQDPGVRPSDIVIDVVPRLFDGTDVEGARVLVCTLSAAARLVADGWPDAPPRLWIITHNGLPVTDTESGDPTIGALKGLIRTWGYPGEAARVLAEEPDVRATLIDVDTAADLVAVCGVELQSAGNEDVVAWRGGRRYVERLSRVVPAPRNGAPVVRGDGSYLVTGGLGGIGMVVAGWLVDNGAGRVVLNARSAPTPDTQKSLDDLQHRAEVVVVRGDITEPGVAERLVSTAEETGRPLCGVIHAAGVMDDHLVANLTAENVHRIWAPKVTGALRLHEVTADHRLDWWIGFSSVSAFLGAPGQAAYASANAWLDALVAWRRAADLPGTTINWGQWADVGMGQSLRLAALDPITPAEGTGALAALIGGDLAQVAVARLRLDRVAATSPDILHRGYFAELLDEFEIPDHDIHPTGADQTVEPVEDWSQVPAPDVLPRLEHGLRSILAHELGTLPSLIDAERTFPELGLDSMMAMGLLKAAKRFAGIDLSPTMLWNHPTISSLAAHLAETIATRVGSPAETEAGAAPTTSVLDALFDSVESAAARNESVSR